ncbi:hypothetical protein MTR67_007001 [Solanum verrucosum]|uniref:RNase H type-1 domain-containing protein n=1 Tax=Solanum verrucosum TaxID=315347 RepID=A0AAF0Q496_SOLVR|nr:hypothetical protein MTR67_007001 [Solanum verrucosum]
MEKQVLWHIRAATGKAYPNLKLDYPWVQICDIVVRLGPKTISKVALWTIPNQGSIKINTNGSYIDHNDKAGIGGIARDCNGDFVFTFTIPVQCQNHNIAEALAAQYASQWINDNNHRFWEDATFSHCYREANKVADFLAKLVITLDEPVLYHSLNQMPGG